MIVRSGRALLKDLIKGDTSVGITHIAIGTGTDTTTDEDTAMGNEIFQYTSTDRIPASGGMHGDGSIKIKGLLNALQTNFSETSQNEIGLFNSNSSGSMFLRNGDLSAPVLNTSSRMIRYKIIINSK